MPAYIPPELKAQKADENHLWLNALDYLLYPTDEQKIKLADMILAMLKDHDRTLPDPELPYTRFLYLSINAS